MTEAIANGISAALLFVILAWIIGIAIFFGIVAITVVIVKKIWYADSKKKPAEPEVKWSPTGWYWDPKTRKWTPPDYLNEEARTRWRWDPDKRIWIDLQKNNDHKWAYNESAKIWVDASQVDYDRHERANAAVRAKWDQYYQEKAELEALRTPIHLTQEERELAKQISVDRTEMTFEEWKAARAKEQHPEQ